MGLPPSEFYRFTYAELRVYLDGCYKRMKLDVKMKRDQDAWLASTLINFIGTLSEVVSPAMLLGKVKPRQKKTKEQELDDALRLAFKRYVRNDG